MSHNLEKSAITVYIKVDHISCQLKYYKRICAIYQQTIIYCLAMYFFFLSSVYVEKKYEIARDMKKWSKYLKPYCFCIVAGSSCLGEVNDCEY